ncbi:MAG: SIMPL domain-containing protein [Dinoroseobacter sp.]|nr:SIMPL domain-containing protein [Dinoroseobacter sp.]
MPNLYRLILLCASLVLCGVAALAQAEQTVDPTIVVTGQGSVTAAPDIAALRLGVTTQDQSAAEALAQNSKRMQAVMDLFAVQGIDARDIQTSDFSVQPVYERDANGARSEIIGYTVRNLVMVRVQNLESLGSLLDAVVSEGSNTLQSLSFGLSDTAALETQAEAAAVADAVMRAEGMAAAAGLALGPVQRIEAVGGIAPRPQMEMSARAADFGSVPVAGGELTIRAQVRVTIALID